MQPTNFAREHLPCIHSSHPDKNAQIPRRGNGKPSPKGEGGSSPPKVPRGAAPAGLSRSTENGKGKRPDGLTLIPWRAGRSLIWDVTVSSTTADSYLETSREAGAAAKLATF